MHAAAPKAINELLKQKNLTIGRWNEICDVTLTASFNQIIAPPPQSRESISFAKLLLDWIAGNSNGWMLIQADNSMCLLDDDIHIFNQLVCSENPLQEINNKNRSFIIEKADEALLTLIIYFALLFEWHIYLVSEHSQFGQRLGLLDGIVYLIGTQDKVTSFKELSK